MIVNNVKIYGVEESCIASGYPMKTEIADNVSANNKDWTNVKNENLKNLSTYDLEKNIIHYSKKYLKYLKYVLNQYNINYIYNV